MPVEGPLARFNPFRSGEKPLFALLEHEQPMLPDSERARALLLSLAQLVHARDAVQSLTRVRKLRREQLPVGRGHVEGCGLERPRCRMGRR